MTFSVQQIINIAKISQYLAVEDIKKGGLDGGGQDLLLPRKLYCIRKSIEYIYNISPSESSLYKTSNYLLALCAPYSLEAEYILNNGSGGGISPITPSVPLSPLEFEVDNSSPIPTGSGSIILDSGNRDFRGFNLIVSRGNQSQTQVNDGLNSYYSWNKGTGLFQIFPNATGGELISITPVA